MSCEKWGTEQPRSPQHSIGDVLWNPPFNCAQTALSRKGREKMGAFGRDNPVGQNPARATEAAGSIKALPANAKPSFLRADTLCFNIGAHDFSSSAVVE
jgi:hypothetical protein